MKTLILNHESAAELLAEREQAPPDVQAGDHIDPVDGIFPYRCPRCEGEGNDIQYDNFELETMSQEAQCMECGCTWFEQYRPDYIEIIDPGEDR